MVLAGSRAEEVRMNTESRGRYRMVEKVFRESWEIAIARLLDLFEVVHMETDVFRVANLGLHFPGGPGRMRIADSQLPWHGVVEYPPGVLGYQQLLDH